MTFLPIVVRELRVAARKRRTFWLRIAAAFVALVIGIGVLTISSVGAFPPTSLGGVLFSILTWIALVTTLAAGLFFTSDCLSEEKREGTLGFLFLTDLRGYDVTGGKLLATSLRAFYALLAVFPILALTLTMGGVTGSDFWRTALALVNALFCSLTAGMFISSISRDSQKALGGTVFLLIVWLAAGPIIDALLAQKRGTAFSPFFSLSSPFFVFSQSSSWNRSGYWTALLVTQVIAWLLLALASLLIPRTWQEKKSRRSSATSTWSYAWRHGGRSRRTKVREKLMGLNPVMWLVSRERWQSIGLWAFALFLGGSALLLYLVGWSEFAMPMWGGVSGLFVWLLYLWTASQASRFFVDARRCGLTELLLATPLTVGEILRGHWRAFGRLFAVPVLLIVGLVYFGAMIGQTSMWGNVSGMRASQAWVLAVGSAFCGAIAAVANLIALTWFGMWMGLTSRTYSVATLKTFGFVQAVPALVITFAVTLAMFAGLVPMMMKAAASGGKAGASTTAFFGTWFPMVMVGATCLFTVLKDVGFALWARHRLHTSFREVASRSFGPPHPAALPVIALPPITPRLPPPIPPPLIPTQP